MNRILSRLGITALTLVAGPALIAQTATTGAVSGVVTDVLGAPLAGATVRFTSRQIARETTTGPEGRYSLGLLNAGPWTLTVTKAGFATARQAVALSINAIATVAFKLPKEGAVPEAPTGPLPDLTHTATGATFDSNAFEPIPLGRDLASLALLAPGVSAAASGGLSIAGGSGAENVFSVDGFKTNNRRTGGQGLSMVPDFLEQLEVQTGGFKPEDNATGGVVNALTRSGTNEFSGSSWVDLAPSALKPAPKANGFYSEAKAASTYEVGSWVGGALVKDKLFYALGLDCQHTQAPAYTGLGGLPVASTSTPSRQYFAKFNYFLAPDRQLTFSTFGNTQTATQGGGETKDDSSNFLLVYDTVLNPATTFSFKAGRGRNEHQVTGLDSASGDGTTTDTQLGADWNSIQGNHVWKYGLSQIKSTSTLLDTTTEALYQTFYIQDAWQSDKDLNIFYGFRSEHQTLDDTTGRKVINLPFGRIQPRLGFTCAVSADGLSKVSGSYAWYNGEILNPGALYAGNQGSVDSKIKAPKRTEVQLGFDRQVSSTTTLGVHGHYRKLTDPIVESVITLANGHPIDPSDTTGLPVLWNPGASVSWTSPISGQGVNSNATLFPTATNTYQALDLTYARMTPTNLLACSYTWSRSEGTYPGLGLTDANHTYAYYPYAGKGLTPLDHTHQFKAYGYQKVQVGAGALSLGFNLLIQSGTPYSLEDNGLSTYGRSRAGLNLGDPGGYGNATYVNGAMGRAGRTPTASKLDLNVHYEMQLSSKFILEPMLEVFNVLNARPATQVVEQSMDASGTAYPAGKYASPTQYQPGRSFRFGARLLF